eukprot:gene17786-24820_t
MGLPIDKLVICTNENDVLHRFFKTGTYKKSPTTLTIAPSMDISVSSNFERYLFYVANESSEILSSWMNVFEKSGELNIPPQYLAKAKLDFISASSTKSQIIDAMKDIYAKEKYLVCPHTATAVVGIRSYNLPPATTVCLATAHPAKFEEAVGLALSKDTIPPRPEILDSLFRLPTRVTFLPNSLSMVESFIRSKNEKKSAKKSDNTVYWASFITIIAIGAIVFARYTYK